MNGISIEVSGAANTGKSTVIQLIEHVLTENGITYNFKEGDQETRDRGLSFAYVESFDNRINTLKNNVNIEISTKQLNRAFLNKKKGEE